MNVEKLQIILLPILIVVMAFLIAVPLYPMVLGVLWVYQKWHNLFLTLFIGSYAYLVYTSLLMIEAIVVKRLFKLSPREGEFGMMDGDVVRWALSTMLIQMVRYVGNLGLLRSTPFLVYYMRGMGAKVGRGVVVNTVKIYDMDLLEIGDNAVIGGDVVLMAHSGEGKKVILKRVRIGKGATIGQSATLLAGAEIGEGAIVGAMSVVPKNKVVPPYSIWRAEQRLGKRGGEKKEI